MLPLEEILKVNTTADNNTAVGRSALEVNTSGTQNTVVTHILLMPIQLDITTLLVDITH